MIILSRVIDRGSVSRRGLILVISFGALRRKQQQLAKCSHEDGTEQVKIPL